MIFTTLNKIRTHQPCADGWQKLLEHLGKTQADDEPLALTTILDSNGLNDTLWCLRSVPEHDREWRLFAVWCARQVQHLMTDPRSIAALDVAERHVNGLASEEELAAAEAAAWAAGAAARAAAGAAARAAAGAAARAAAGAAARAAEAAARAAQEAELRRILRYHEMTTTKFKPFDLEAAKRGDKIQTISGEPRRFLLHDPLLQERERLITATEDGCVIKYFENGKYLQNEEYLHMDLCMATRKRQMWARVYRWTATGDVMLRNDVAPGSVHLLGSPCGAEWLGPAVLVAEWEE